MAETDAPDPSAVHAYLTDLQDQICDALEREDGHAQFSREETPGPGGGIARPRAMQGGPLIEKAAVHFTHAKGTEMPPTATERRPELAGAPFEAVSLSMIVYPRNPYVPVTHMNLRCFIATPKAGEAIWWFGGGFDLTPTYGFEEDAIHWHRTARDACAPFGEGAYLRFKTWCDEYFFLPHRGEARGVGGVFFDDLVLGDFPNTFAFLRSIGDHFLPAYLPLVQRRRAMSHGEREREFQLLRRGRYVEFNLVYDRGTKYGLQSGRRVESVLASMPPLVSWTYDWQPEPGSPEARLAEEFLAPRDWLGNSPQA